MRVKEEEEKGKKSKMFIMRLIQRGILKERAPRRDVSFRVSINRGGGGGREIRGARRGGVRL